MPLSYLIQTSTDTKLDPDPNFQNRIRGSGSRPVAEFRRQNFFLEFRRNLVMEVKYGPKQYGIPSVRNVYEIPYSVTYSNGNPIRDLAALCRINRPQSVELL